MISVLLPIYNGKEFLDECIPSILNQTFGKFEILVGINGHDEKSAAVIVEKLKSFKDSRIKILICPYKGKVRALNRLVPHARYKHIALIDADDLWLPNKLEEQIKFIDKYDVVGSDIEYFGDKDGSPQLFLGRLIKQYFSWQNPLVSSAVILKKEDAFWSRDWGDLEDYNLWITLMKRGKTFYNVPQVLAKHRIHKNSYFNNKNKEAGDQTSLLRLPRLTDEEMWELTEIMDNKKWKE